MGFKTFARLAACCGALSAYPAAAQDIEALADLYGALPATSAPDVSPDGRFVARRVVHGGEYVLRVDPLGEAGKPFAWKPSDEASLGRYDWTGDGTILVTSRKLAATRSRTVDEKGHRSNVYVDFFQALRPQVLTTEGKTVTELTFRRLGDIRTFRPLADPETARGSLPVFVTSENAHRIRDVFKPAEVSLRKNDYAFLPPPIEASGFFQYHGDRAGRVMIALHREFGGADRTAYKRTDGRWARLDLDLPGGAQVAAVLDETTLLLREGGTLFEYDMDTGARGQSLHEGAEDAYPVFEPGTGTLMAISADGALDWRQPGAAARHARTEAIVGAGPLDWTDQSHDGQVRVAYGEAGRGTHYVVDARVGTVLKTWPRWPDLEGRPRAEVREVAYDARDGLKIEGYLSVPQGSDPASLPLVVHPHGGPASRDTARFDPWREYLTALGFAVFQPNFRGSTGYGEDFARAGYTEWGAAMQTDIVDGVAYLAREGLADPGRTAIFGASYGGYAALMGTLDETPYRCAVSLNGVSDLPGMLDTEQIGAGFDYWVDHIGRDALTGEELARRSPLRRAGEIDVPVLLIHGVMDTTVRKGQSAALEAAMREAGKDVTAIYLAKSDHYLELEAERRRAFAEVGKFLTNCLN